MTRPCICKGTQVRPFIDYNGFDNAVQSTSHKVKDKPLSYWHQAILEGEVSRWLHFALSVTLVKEGIPLGPPLPSHIPSHAGDALYRPASSCCTATDDPCTQLISGALPVLESSLGERLAIRQASE